MSKALLTDEEKKEFEWGTEYMSDYDTAICKAQAIKVLKAVREMLLDTPDKNTIRICSTLELFTEIEIAEIEGEEALIDCGA